MQMSAMDLYSLSLVLKPRVVTYNVGSPPADSIHHAQAGLRKVGNPSSNGHFAPVDHIANALVPSTSYGSTASAQALHDISSSSLAYSNGSNTRHANASSLSMVNSAASAGLLNRRSASSLISLPHTVAGASSLVGDGNSTAPSSIAHSQSASLSASLIKSGRLASTEGTLRVYGTLPSPSDIAEDMRRLCLEAMSRFQCIVTCQPLDANAGHHVHISGIFQQAISARGHILQGNPYQSQSTISAPRHDILDAQDRVRVDIQQKLEDIMALTKARLFISTLPTNVIDIGLEAEKRVAITIHGPYENVEQGRIRILVLIDELAGMHSDICEIDYKLHAIIAGRKRSVLRTIQEETACNIYLPTPLSGTLDRRDSAIMLKQNFIFLTGEYFGVQRAKDLLFQASISKARDVMSRDVPILPRKLDWILSERTSELLRIMRENATFIKLPDIGSNASMISVLGDRHSTIARTLRDVALLVCSHYVAQLWILPPNYAIFGSPTAIAPSEVPNILKHIALSSGAEAIFKSNCFEFHGTEASIRSALLTTFDLDPVRSQPSSVRVQIELAAEHREFLAGKKDGKVNKIMKSTGVRIKFEHFNDFNFLVDLTGQGAAAMHGLMLLQEELPAEISFHIPEVYHKRIIGVGGKSIQRVMKQYGVYVKFSNAEEHASVGGYHEVEDNVVARTPAKNAQNLQELKVAIMEMVVPRDKNYVTHVVSIPRKYHRNLANEKKAMLHDIDKRNSTTVVFPDASSGSDDVTLFGPESQMSWAVNALHEHVPLVLNYKVPATALMLQLLISADFKGLQDRLQADFQVVAVPEMDTTAPQNSAIRLHLTLANAQQLSAVREAMEEFLEFHDVSSQADLRRRSKGLSSNSASPEARFRSSANDAIQPTQPPIGTHPTGRARLSFSQGATSALDPIRPYPLGSSAIAALPSVHRSSDSLSSIRPDKYSIPAIGTGQPSSFIATHSTRSSEDSMLPIASKRESDSTVVDARMRELLRNGTISHHLSARAQSLDISRNLQAFSRGTSRDAVDSVSAALEKLGM